MIYSNKIQRFFSDYTPIDFVKDFLKELFFSILIWLLYKSAKVFIKKGFKTHRFVAFKMNRRIVSTESTMTCRLTEDTSILALYKLGVIAPVYIMYYKILLKMRPILAQIRV